MRKFLLTVALVLSASSAYANEIKIAQATDQPKATESNQAEPVRDAKKKPVAKKRESQEAKARRIAKKYGVTW